MTSDKHLCFPQYRLKNSNEEWRKTGDKYTFTAEESIEAIKGRIGNDKEQYSLEEVEVDFAISL